MRRRLPHATPNRLHSDERGAILPMMAIMLIVLMGAAAMAVDLGWLFWQSIEIQHGADAGALAGVVYEPNLRTEAHAEGIAAAAENGYDNADPDTTVVVLDFVDDPTAVENENQLRVTVTHSVQTFFMKVFGLGSVDIKRTAVSQYVLPIARPTSAPRSRCRSRLACVGRRAEGARAANAARARLDG